MPGRRPLPEDVPLPLGELPQAPPPPPPSLPAGGEPLEPLLTADYVASLLGVCRKTLRRRDRDGSLPATPIGGKVMYRRRDVENYIDQLGFEFERKDNTK